MKKLIYLFVFLLSVNFVYATDIAYILSNTNQQDNNIKNILDNLGLTYDVIGEDELSSVNLDEYFMILVGGSGFSNAKNVPVGDIKSFIISGDSTDIEDWGIAEHVNDQSVSGLLKGRIEINNEITEGFFSPILLYIESNKVAYILPRTFQRAPGMINVVATDNSKLRPYIGIIPPEGKLFNGKIANERIAFFGLRDSDAWSGESRLLFERTLSWVLKGEDKDNDGFPVDLLNNGDCDDDIRDDPIICNDRLDGPLDCSNDNYLVCAECINPAAREIMDDIDQNCVNEAPILIQNFNSLTWDEDTNLEIDMSLHFDDLEGDDLNYDLVNVGNIIMSTDNDLITLIPDQDFFGTQEGKFTASDGEFLTSSNNLDFIVRDTFDPDVIDPVITLISPENGFLSTEDEVAFTFLARDETASLLTCNFFFDIDNVFGILENNEFTVNSNQEKTIFVGTNEGIPDGNYVWNIQCSDGTNSAFAPENRNFIVDENDPPILENINDITVSEGELVSITLIANDADNDVLAYSISDTRFIKNNNIFTWNTDFDDAGEYTFLVSVSDGVLEDEQEVRVKVNNINRAPSLIRNLGNVNVDEDGSFEVNLNEAFIDPDNDDLEFSFTEGEHLIISILNGIAKVLFEQDWFGVTQISFSATDGEFSIDSNEIAIFVNSINDKPIIQTIDDITVNEGDLVEANLIVSDAENDVLKITYSDPLDDNGRWQTDSNDAGVYEITASVTDGFLTSEINFKLTVNNVNVNPVLGEVPEITIEEDSGEQEVWTLSATDEDSTGDLIFSVEREGNINCNVIDNKLFVNPDRNFFGSDTCRVRVTDSDRGIDEQDVVFVVNGLQDDPEIVNFFPRETNLVLSKNKVQNFLVVARDVDDDELDIDWFVNDQSVSGLLKGIIDSRRGINRLVFNANVLGNHVIKVEVSDGNTIIDRKWFVEVKEGVVVEEKLSCSELNGFICNAGESCGGNLLDSSNANTCCSIACTVIGKGKDNKTIEHLDLDSCENGVIGDLDIDIQEPDNNDEFSPKDEFTVEVEVQNDGDDDIRVIVEAILFDVDEEDKIDKVKSDSSRIDEDDEEGFTLEIEIPGGDIDDDNDFILFVKAYEKGNEKEQCAEDQIDIDIERDSHDVVFNEFELEPNIVSCGGMIRANIELENIGGSEEEDMFVRIKIPELNIEYTTGLFTLEEHDEDRNKIRKVIPLDIPKNTEMGDYEVIVEAVYDDITTKRDVIKVEECVVEPVVFNLDTEVGVEATLQKMRGDDLTIPILIKNEGTEFAEFNVRLSNHNLIDTISQNVLLGPKKSRQINMRTKVRDSANFGEHILTTTVSSNNKLINSDSLLVRVVSPEEIEKEGLGEGYLFSLGILNVLVILIIVYLSIAVFK